ncbi:TPA: Nmad5 family putative nucleotide modification protein [Providencia alcalifaciens]
MTVRLTNAIKDSIKNNALAKAGIFKQKEELKKEFNQLALDVRTEALGGEDKVKKMELTLEVALSNIKMLEEEVSSQIGIYNAESASLRPAFGGQRIRLRYGKDSNGKDIYLLTPAENKCLFAADHELSKRFEKLNKKEINIEKKEADIEANVQAALNSVTTIKRLIEIWPESKELISNDISRATATLPALQVEDLNKLIGLPTDKK